MSTIQFFQDGFTVEHHGLTHDLFRHHFFCHDSVRLSADEFSEVLSRSDNLEAIMRLSDMFPGELSVMILESEPLQIGPIAY